MRFIIRTVMLIALVWVQECHQPQRIWRFDLEAKRMPRDQVCNVPI